MADGGEIAKAWVTIIPTAKGMTSGIESELGGVGGKAGDKAGKGFMGGLGKAAGTAAKIAGGAAALVGGAIAGVALKGGFDRAMNIEAAQAKLSGLGHSADSVTKIMDNASAAVKGTAFGMGDAAGVAASIVASGVKPGQDLQKTLTLVGDAAAIAGTDMGSMGAIFSKVAASNKLQGDTIAQLHDAGIPALQLVADEMGVTAEEASAMASKGEVDFATFQRAMQEGMGGAALKSGETFAGAMANTKAALGRIGETILTPFLGALTSGANGIIPVFDSMNAALKPVMESFGQWLSGIDFAGAFAGIGDVFGQISAVATPFLTQLGSTFAPLIPQVIELVTNLSPMSLLFQSLAPVLPLIGTLLQTIAQALSMVLQAVLPIVQQVAGFLIPLFTQLYSAVLPPLIGVVTQVVAAIGPLVQALGPILQSVLTALMPIVQTVFGIIQTVITTVLGVVSGIISAFTSVLRGDWAGFWAGIGQVFSTILTGIGDFAKQFFGDLPGAILSALGDLGSLLVNAGKQILEGFLNGLTDGFNKVKNFVGGIGSWIADNKGPKAYDLALLIPAGNWIMDGLGKGIESSMPALGSKLSDVSWMIQNGIDPNLDASIGATASAVPAMSAHSAASVDPAMRGEGLTVKQEIHANDTEEIIQESNARMFTELRQMGAI
ncbi:tape measure protein [Streptomyces diacarni]|uniref:phage tail protein n=1 Tax=Streptomyces diacarni TaxID=2800381 RepID=UPI00341008A5